MQDVSSYASTVEMTSVHRRKCPACGLPLTESEDSEQWYNVSFSCLLGHRLRAWYLRNYQCNWCGGRGERDTYKVMGEFKSCSQCGGTGEGMVWDNVHLWRFTGGRCPVCGGKGRWESLLPTGVEPCGWCGGTGYRFDKFK